MGKSIGKPKHSKALENQKGRQICISMISSSTFNIMPCYVFASWHLSQSVTIQFIYLSAYYPSLRCKLCSVL